MAALADGFLLPRLPAIPDPQIAQVAALVERVTAAARADEGAGIDWAALAADLGYADQAHLTRDFTAAVGAPPGRYAGG